VLARRGWIWALLRAAVGRAAQTWPAARMAALFLLSPTLSRACWS
jgi:hypothetical protein